MTDWIEDMIERVENVVYLAVAVILFAVAAVVIGKTVLTFGDLGTGSVVDVAADILDLLLLVFIVVELLFAVRTTLNRRELVAEPFLLVGIIASIKEIVVLSVKAADEIGTGTAFSDAMWEVAILGVLVLLLGATALLLRRKEREPGEGDDQGPFQADQAGDPPG